MTYSSSCALILCGGGIFACVLYLKPLAVNKTLIMCTLEGEKKEVTLNVYEHRHFFSPSTITGTIEMNAKEYISIYDTNISLKQGGFVENLKKKVTGQTNYQYFILPKTENMEMFQNHIQLKMDETFETFVLLWSCDGNLKVYYGPAYTEEAAEMIARKQK